MRDVGIYNIRRALPRMSWSPVNLYNLWSRCFGDKKTELEGMKTAHNSLFTNRWISKRLVRAYHGDFIPEKVYKRWYMLETLPNVRPRAISHGDDNDSLLAFARRKRLEEEYNEQEGKAGLAPVGSLMFSPVERRIDVFVFRCCFAHSVYEARRLVIHGHVLLNGKKHSSCNTRLTPGDMISVDPTAMRFFTKPVQPHTDVRQVIKDRQSLSGAPTTPKDSTQSPGAAESVDDSAARAREARELEHKLETGQIDPSTVHVPGVDIPFLDIRQRTPEPSPYDALELPLDRPDIESTLSLETASSGSQTEVPEAEGKSQELAKARPSQSDTLTPFYLPTFATPWLFVPAYIEVNFATCSAVYVRHPTARPGYSEIPTPYAADGDVIRFAWEYYTKRRPRIRSKKQLSRMPEDRDYNPTPVELDRSRRLLRMQAKRKIAAMSGVIR